MTTSPQGITERPPLTEEELQAIRDRVTQLAVSIGGEYRVHAELAADVPALLAEVDRLRAEVERRERQIGLHLKLANAEVKRADALAAKLAAVQALGQSWRDAVPAIRLEIDGIPQMPYQTNTINKCGRELLAALGETGGTE